MWTFVLRRLTVCVATLLTASFATFGSLYLAPGDPVSFLIGGRPSSQETRDSLARQFDLDRPFLQRYVDWVGGVLRGDFGESLIRRQPVSDLLRASMTTTLLLVAMTFALVLVVGVAVGALAALRPGRVDDIALTAMSLSIATPAFVAAVLLISVFAVQTGWFPVFGSGDGLLDRLHHLVLPSLALSIGWWPVIGQTTRAAMRDELGKEHVETALGRGLPRRTVIRRHVLRNALIPISTVSGLSLAGLVAGTAIVESAFQLNGVGGLLIKSVSSHDFPVAQAIALLLVAVFSVCNFMVDLLYSALDPRVGVRA